MDNRLRLAMMLVLVSVVLVGMAAVVSAQGGTQPQQCENPRYDFDGNGSIDRNDLDGWKWLYLRSGCDPTSKRSPVEPGGCSPLLDLNGDGYATPDDFNELFQVYLICRRGAQFVRPPQ